MNNIRIAVCDTDEQVVFQYEAPIVPRKGELIHLHHRGAFRILEVAYRIADDTWVGTRLDELLMYVEVIVDFSNQVKDYG